MSTRVPMMPLRLMWELLNPKGFFRPFEVAGTLRLYITGDIRNEEDRTDMIKVLFWIVGAIGGMGILLFLPLVVSLIALAIGYVVITATNASFFHFRLVKAGMDITDAINRQKTRNSFINYFSAALWIVIFIGTLYQLMSARFGI